MVKMDSSIQIPGYKLIDLLGKGGMAIVYLAIQESLERKVALKVMNASLASDAAFCKRFLKEGKIVAKFSSHPDIVTIYDIGYSGSYYYMAMEYVPGTSLKEHIQQKRELDQHRSIIRQVARALGYAHSLGFIHRDVKPANILFREDGSAILTDFGIAKSLDSNTQLTKIGYTIGTPEYMSPEQALGQNMDARSDLYSLGVVIYEMLTGQKPFVGEDAFATAMMHLNSPVPRLPNQFAQYQLLIDRLMAKDPNDRFDTADRVIGFVDGMAEAKRRSSASGLRNKASKERETLPMEESTQGASGSAAPSAEIRNPFSWKWMTGIGLSSVSAIAIIIVVYQLVISGVSTNDSARENVVTPPLANAKVDSGSRALDPALQEKVDRLLKVAEVHMEVGRLTEPKGSNAYEAFKLVLEIDPNNRQAEEGLRQIEQRLKQQGG
jgi:serine/threonine-protein kinase PpkA